MLPIFRVLPLGGVFLAVAILLLALQPPRATPPLASALLAARGPLIDRGEHPEFRQFFVLAALHRADAVERLGAIPETHIPPAPFPRKPQAGLSLSTPAPATLISPEAAPVVAPAPEAKMNLPEEAKTSPKAEGDAKPPTVDGAVRVVAVAPAAAPVAEATPAATPAKSTDEKPPAVAIAALPPPRPQNDNGTVTASVGADDENTMPDAIGGPSAPELAVVMPQERPPALRKLHHHPVHKASSKPRHTVKLRHKPRYAPVRTAHRRRPTARRLTRKATQPNAEDSFDLFTAMFGPPQPAVTSRRGQP